MTAVASAAQCRKPADLLRKESRPAIA